MIADILGCRVEHARRILASLSPAERNGAEHLAEKQMTATFYPQSVLTKVAGQLNKSHQEVNSELILVEHLAARLRCSAEDIIRYFPGDKHYRTIEKSGEKRTIILPSAAKEIAKAPPAPKGWLSIQDLRTLLVERFAPSDTELAQTLDAVAATFNLQTKMLKPYNPKTGPRHHFPPEAVVFAARHLSAQKA
jgi:hypothetical protein